MFNQYWETTYEGHNINIKNSWFGATELYVNKKLQDKSINFFNGKLMGKIITKEKEINLRIIVTATLFSVECIIFADNILIYSSKK